MNVTEPYLDSFAMPGIGDQPTTVQLNEWEDDNDWSITLDDVDDQALAINYYDEWPSTEQWKIQPGAEKRWTFVRITKDGVFQGKIGWEFKGLHKPDMLRAWFIQHLGLKMKNDVIKN